MGAFRGWCGRAGGLAGARTLGAQHASPGERGGPAGGTLNTPDWASVRPPKTESAHSIDGATHAGAARPSPENKNARGPVKPRKKFAVRALGFLPEYDDGARRLEPSKNTSDFPDKTITKREWRFCVSTTKENTIITKRNTILCLLYFIFVSKKNIVP